MMVTYAMTGCLGLILVMSLIIWVLRSKNTHLNQENYELKRHLNLIQKELDNAILAKKINHTNRTLSDDDVDNKLQNSGYFRSE